MRYEIESGIAWVTIDRPQARNALNTAMWQAIVRACERGDADPQVQVTVITGIGDVYTAGGDINEALSEWDALDAGSGLDSYRLVGNGPNAHFASDPIVAIQHCTKLVISGVNGICHGGGVALAMQSDLTIAAESATFCVPEALRGFVDPWIAARLPLFVGIERAKAIVLRCKPFSAAQALEWGFVSEVVPDDQLLSRTRELALELQRTSPEARAYYKAASNRLFPSGDADGPDYREAERVHSSSNTREGFRSFIERRLPSWAKR